MADTLTPEKAAEMSTAELERTLTQAPKETIQVSQEPEKIPVTDTRSDTEEEEEEEKTDKTQESEQAKDETHKEEGEQQEKQEEETKASQEENQRPKKRFVPRQMMERIARERDEARKELQELKELLARVEKQLVPPVNEDKSQDTETEEDLTAKLLENPREVLDRLLSQRISPIEQQIKIATLSNIRKELATKYSDYQEVEPRMIELSRELFPPDTFSPDILLKPGIVEKLYLMAKAERMDEIISAERKKAQEEILKKEEAKSKAVFETGKSVGKTPSLTPEQAANMSLKDLEKMLPKFEE